MTERDLYIKKIKQLSKAVDIKKNSKYCDITTSNVWSGKISLKKARRLYNQLLTNIFYCVIDNEED